MAGRSGHLIPRTGPLHHRTLDSATRKCFDPGVGGPSGVARTTACLREFERQFDRMTRQAAQAGPAMAMDGIRRKDDVVLRFDLPGIDPGSIELTVDRGVLSVSAAVAAER